MDYLCKHMKWVLLTDVRCKNGFPVRKEEFLNVQKMNSNTVPSAPKKIFRSGAQRITHRQMNKAMGRNEGQLSISYFTQILDIETVCSNALRKLRNDESFEKQFTENLQANEWMYKFDMPLQVKY